MIKCKNGTCPVGKFDGCCIMCKEHGTCEEACDNTPDTCGDSFTVADTDAESEETALVAFKAAQLAVLEQVAQVIKNKKDAEAQEEQLKEKLKEAMEKFGIKKFESEVLNVTYVAETDSIAIDSAKAKKLIPDWEESCSKKSHKKSYVKVELKK